MAKTIYVCGLSMTAPETEYLIKTPIDDERKDVRFEFYVDGNTMNLFCFNGGGEDKSIVKQFGEKEFEDAGGEIFKLKTDNVPLCTMNEDFVKQPAKGSWSEICKHIKGGYRMLDKLAAIPEAD